MKENAVKCTNVYKNESDDKLKTAFTQYFINLIKIKEEKLRYKSNQ